MLDERTRELIAVGAAIAANCQPCLDYHTGKALELGATDADILTAIEVGKQVRVGAAGKMDRYTANRAGAPQPTASGDCGYPK